MTQALLLLGVMALLLAFGVPVAFSIGLSGMFFLLVTGLKPMVVVAQSSVNGVDSFTMLAIPMFTLAGYLMESSGMSKRLVNCMEKLLGNSTGGVGTVTIVCCAIFAALTGSGPATVTAIGCIMLPAMLNAGYSRGETGGMLSAAGALGPIIPPSICMIVYGSTMGVAVPDLFIAAVIPGILLAVAMILANSVMSRRRSRKIAADVPKKHYTSKEVLASVVQALPTLFLPVIILGGIYSGIFTPTEVAVVAVFYTIFWGFIYREMKFADIVRSLKRTVATTGMVMFIMAMAAVFTFLLSTARIPTMIARSIVPYLNNRYVFMALMLVLLLIAGCIMEVLSLVVILAPIIIPIGLQLGADPIHLGVTFCITLVVGLATPPFGMNLFTASAVCETPFVEVVKGVWPYLIAMAVTIVLIAFIPQLTLLLPSLL
ncbi:TRAP transporter large permease [Clostridium sp. AN503]|uniref:TRAP transporter large permease n=1 Tax=Clostridium sp. AN503 TaxID=3160598 RepID=UPI00345752A8